MGKKFTQTMTLESFKDTMKDTPEMKVNAFIKACQVVENAEKKAFDNRKEIMDMFHQRSDRFLFVWEHLEPYPDFTASELVNMMKLSEKWLIQKVKGEDRIIIMFGYEGLTFQTVSFDVNEFVEFLNGEYDGNYRG
jgi:hypothetical protein